MSSVASNLKAIYRQGRDSSIQALVADIKEKYAKYLESGRDVYNYCIIWKTAGYFMSPYSVKVDTGPGNSEFNIYDCKVPDGEMHVFMLEVARVLESDGIYSSCNTCTYETTPSIPSVYHMVISMRLSLNKPPKEWRDTGGY